MGYFQDTRTCDEHGFVLSPEGTCVRCVKDETKRARQRRIAKAATGITVIIASLLGFSAARARMRTSDPPAPVATVATPALTPAPVVRAEAVAPTEAPQASSEWDKTMARAEAERQRIAIAQAAAEKQREVAALAIPTPEPESAETREDPPATTADPAFARSGYRTQTRLRRGAAGVVPVGGVNGGTNNPSAWGLPANNGGNFGNHRAGH
jgi:hypothetical protein